MAEKDDDDDGKGGKPEEIKVTPADLTRFAKMLRDQLDDVDAAKTSIDKIDIIPGNFADAGLFRTLVGHQEGGRANKYSSHLAELKLALTRFADKLDWLATNYDTVESLNKDLADKINELKNEVEPLLPGNPV